MELKKYLELELDIQNLLIWLPMFFLVCHRNFGKNQTT